MFGFHGPLKESLQSVLPIAALVMLLSIFSSPKAVTSETVLSEYTTTKERKMVLKAPFF